MLYAYCSLYAHCDYIKILQKHTQVQNVNKRKIHTLRSLMVFKIMYLETSYVVSYFFSKKIKQKNKT